MRTFFKGLYIKPNIIFSDEPFVNTALYHLAAVTGDHRIPDAQSVVWYGDDSCESESIT